GAAEFSYIFGNPGDKPFVGDFNGDGVDTLGLHRESTGFVYFRQTHTQGIADSEFFDGDPGDRFVSGDWGIVDNIDTPAIFRPSNSVFYFRYSNTHGVAEETLGWGISSFLPIAGNWGAVTPGGPVPDPGGPGPGGPGGPGTPLPLSLSGSLTTAVTQVGYSAQLSIQGGTQPYTVQKVSGPAWAAVSNTGLVSGVPPSGGTGSFTLEVRVIDATGAQVTTPFPLNVVAQCQVLSTVPLAQCLALAQLYNSTGGNAWTERINWFTNPNPCNWSGIQCLGVNVSQISLDDNNLNGTLPEAAFSPLVGLTHLDLDSNNLIGAIPTALGTLPLQVLDLAENGLDGVIPAGIWTRTGLTTLDLNDNTNLIGNIPPEVANLVNLVNLDLADNGFGPTIAAELWTLPALQVLDLANNSFAGPLPASFNLPAIIDIDLSENGLTGAIPDGINTLGTQLLSLDLHDNNLGGPTNVPGADSPIPPEIANLTGLAPVVGSLELRGNRCFTAAEPPLNFVQTRDPAWNNGCTP
ncbi:MAG TPA: putative Ig domain-containing protein, partial [Acidimicrobiia bacterium]|nr:putative Ig domain-containing protein [Acidimicrobiia bacterium]